MNTKLFAGAFGVIVLGLAVGCDDGGSTGGAGGTSSSSTKATTGSMTTSGGMTTTGSSMATLDCTFYCGEIMANCTAGNAQYNDMATCMATCATFPAGTLADTTGNTLGCRIYHGGDPAKSMPAAHCVHAGPSGGDTCGDNCDSFCNEATKLCPMQWPELAACKTACDMFADTVPYNTGTMSGDTFACRQYHLMAASTAPTPHCDHTIPVSATCN